MSSRDYESIKDGDPVYLVSYGGMGGFHYAKAIVARATKTRFSLVDGRKFRKEDGSQINGGRYSPILIPWTPEFEAQLVAEEKLKSMQYQVRKAFETIDIGKLSVEQCQEILNIVTPGTLV